MTGIACLRKSIPRFPKMLLVACVIIASTTLVVYIFSTLIEAANKIASQVRVHTDEIVTVYDKSKRVMPVYYQNDPTWSATPYLGGTIESHGCGLTCAAMACSYIFDTEVTPDMLASEVGDTCSSAGVNDMLKFAEWLSSKSQSGINYTRVWLLEYVRDYIGEDVIVFVGMKGPLGDRWYESHVIMLHNLSDSGAMVYDPDEPANTHDLTWSELEQVNALYYVIVSVS